jgi:hypothetical protein
MSVNYLALRQDTNRTVNKFFHLTKEAEKYRTKERNAAQLIQRVWRAFNARTYVRYLSEQATQIQRIWKGFIARKRCRALRTAEERRERSLYFSACAILIQKRWRGYQSRKLREDYYRRAQWVHTVSLASKDLNIDAEFKAQRLQQMQQEKLESEASVKFEEMASSLHHLVSTRAIPGIFNSPFGEINQRTAYEVPLDQHLWDAFHNKYTEKKNNHLTNLAATGGQHFAKVKELGKIQSPLKSSSKSIVQVGLQSFMGKGNYISNS